MSETVVFPTTPYQKEYLRMQQKREELTNRRDRLNVRLSYLEKRIATFWEDKKKQEEFWQRLRELREGRDGNGE